MCRSPFVTSIPPNPAFFQISSMLEPPTLGIGLSLPEFIPECFQASSMSCNGMFCVSDGHKKLPNLLFDALERAEAPKFG